MRNTFILVKSYRIYRMIHCLLKLHPNESNDRSLYRLSSYYKHKHTQTQVQPINSITRDVCDDIKPPPRKQISRCQKMCCWLPRVQCLWPRAPILSITSVTSLLQPPSSDPQFPSTSHNTDRDAGTW